MKCTSFRALEWDWFGGFKHWMRITRRGDEVDKDLCGNISGCHGCWVDIKLTTGGFEGKEESKLINGIAKGELYFSKYHISPLAVWNCVKKLLLISVNGLEHSRGCGWL
jgi:hypothetical protein